MTNSALLSIQAKNMADDLEAWHEGQYTDVVAMLRDLAQAVDTLRNDVAMAKGAADYHRSMRVLDSLA